MEHYIIYQNRLCLYLGIFKQKLFLYLEILEQKICLCLEILEQMSSFYTFIRKRCFFYIYTYIYIVLNRLYNLYNFCYCIKYFREYR
jgi:hypothetical protein